MQTVIIKPTEQGKGLPKGRLLNEAKDIVNLFEESEIKEDYLYQIFDTRKTDTGSKSITIECKVLYQHDVSTIQKLLTTVYGKYFSIKHIN